MPKLRVQSFAVSIDGYSAGPNQSLEHPLGVRGPELMEWFVHTRMWREMQRQEGGEAGIDNGIALQGFAPIRLGRACGVAILLQMQAGRIELIAANDFCW